jgi:hypothetical protein
MTPGIAAACPSIARYAERLHARAGTHHHVASPLGAWLLLALVGTASSGPAREQVEGALGLDIETAAGIAATLLDNPHPAVPSAAAVWSKTVTDALADWLRRLPTRVQTGGLPTQQELDAWAREHTLGLIERFPVELAPDTALVAATALATKVSWQEPFEVVPAAELGPASGWAARVEHVLASPEDGHTHQQFIAVTARAGEVVVHAAYAQDDLLVVSVAAAAEVPPVDVLAAAYEIATAIATYRPVNRRSLFDLPLTDTPLWTISERPAQVQAANGREERCRAVLPAWSARTEHDLGTAELGFPAAAHALSGLLELPEYMYEAKQSAMARYGRLGFEAAAVTGFAVAAGMMASLRDGVCREAQLRFAHPYAVVAVATGGTWDGLPVFSAWITEVEEVEA